MFMPRHDLLVLIHTRLLTLEKTQLLQIHFSSFLFFRFRKYNILSSVLTKDCLPSASFGTLLYKSILLAFISPYQSESSIDKERISFNNTLKWNGNKWLTYWRFISTAFTSMLFSLAFVKRFSNYTEISKHVLCLRSKIRKRKYIVVWRLSRSV